MTRQVFAVAPDTSLETVGRLLASRRVSGVPVIDGRGRAIGFITRTDLADPDRARSREVGRSVYFRVGSSPREIALEEGISGEGVVADLMSPFVLATSPDTSVQDAASTMLVDGVHRLLVVEGERIAGIVTTTDVLRAVAGRRARAA